MQSRRSRLSHSFLMSSYNMIITSHCSISNSDIRHLWGEHSTSFPCNVTQLASWLLCHYGNISSNESMIINTDKALHRHLSVLQWVTQTVDRLHSFNNGGKVFCSLINDIKITKATGKPFFTCLAVWIKEWLGYLLRQNVIQPCRESNVLQRQMKG